MYGSHRPFAPEEREPSQFRALPIPNGAHSSPVHLSTTRSGHQFARFLPQRHSQFTLFSAVSLQSPRVPSFARSPVLLEKLACFVTLVILSNNYSGGGIWGDGGVARGRQGERSLLIGLLLFLYSYYPSTRSHSSVCRRKTERSFNLDEFLLADYVYY